MDQMFQSKDIEWDFSLWAVVKTLPSNTGSVGSIPGQETKIPHATYCGQKKVLAWS